MMDARWIIVRDRQASLLAEAETERLARLVRAGDAEREAAEPSAADLEEFAARMDRRLVAAGAMSAAELRVVSNDCQKAA